MIHTDIAILLPVQSWFFERGDERDKFYDALLWLYVKVQENRRSYHSVQPPMQHSHYLSVVGGARRLSLFPLPKA